LTALVGEYEKINLRIDGILHALYRAGDCNGDGDLSLSEFTVVVKIADPTKSAGYVCAVEGSWHGAHGSPRTTDLTTDLTTPVLIKLPSAWSCCGWFLRVVLNLNVL
jgi:hypothetical protein